jgi:hypothetical protein
MDGLKQSWKIQSMDQDQLSAFLAEFDSESLRKLMQAACDELDSRNSPAGPGEVFPRAEPAPADEGMLLKEVKQFQRDSLTGKFYAPFNMNSKNFTQVPGKTRIWFRRLGQLLTDAARLSEQGDHGYAVACFRMLYELLGAVLRGEEIVFAEECGSWLLPVEEKPLMAAYFASLAATTTPEDYATAVLPLLERDSLESFSKKAFSTALRAANPAQKARLKSEVKRQGVRTGR